MHVELHVWWEEQQSQTGVHATPNFAQQQENNKLSYNAISTVLHVKGNEETGKGQTLRLSFPPVPPPKKTAGLVPFREMIIVSFPSEANTCPLIPFLSHPKPLDKFHPPFTGIQSNVSGISVYALCAICANVKTVSRSVTSGTRISRGSQAIVGDCEVYFERRVCVIALAIDSRVIFACCGVVRFIPRKSRGWEFSRVYREEERSRGR